MLQGRLTALVVASLVLIGGCGDGEGAIEENVVRPGVTAMENASALSCEADAAALRQALESYEMLEGSAAVDEAALVAAQYLREQSELFDVVDGQLVAVDPGCKVALPPVTAPSGSAPLTAPATDVGEIVTSIAPGPSAMSVDEVLAAMTADDIAAYGGIECATELAAISAAGQAFVVREARDPADLAELDGDLDREITLWDWDEAGQTLVPAADSGCVFATPTP